MSGDAVGHAGKVGWLVWQGRALQQGAQVAQGGVRSSGRASGVLWMHGGWGDGGLGGGLGALGSLALWAMSLPMLWVSGEEGMLLDSAV